MTQVEEAIEVRVPVRTAYDQWTQFEEFPEFMEGVEQVRQLDDSTMHWVAKIAGQRREWDAKVTLQVPDQRVEWSATSGERNAGAVTFQQIDPDLTRVVLQLDFEPDGALEKTGTRSASSGAGPRPIWNGSGTSSSDEVRSRAPGEARSEAESP